MPEHPLYKTLRDPLSESTRKARRMLVGAGGLAVVMVKANLLPTEISALGIKLDSLDQETLLIAMIVVVGYHLVAFAIYGWTDFLLWRLAVREMRSWASPDEMSRNDRVTARVASSVRIVFEFLVPALVGLYAFWTIVARIYP